jgi:uncharacterized protein YcbX
MNTVGNVDSLWRYPIKSMRGEALLEAFVGYAGVFGDRIYALLDSAAPKGTPYLTGRDRSDMLLYQPRFLDVDAARKPPNQAEAESLGPGLTPVYPDPAKMTVEVATPTGQVLAVDDPALLAMLAGGAAKSSGLSLARSDRAMTDCRPISLISLQTIGQIGEEIGAVLDKRRFRANIYAELSSATGFSEDAFVGRQLQIGPRVVVAVLERDQRCKMIGIDPNTARQSPEILRKVARAHGGGAGVYCAVMREGMVRAGDPIVLLD